MPKTTNSQASASVLRVLPMALACGVAGAAIGWRVVLDAERTTFDDFLFILPPVAFCMGWLGWWLGVVRPNKGGAVRGLVNGAVIGLMVHAVGWFVYFVQGYLRTVLAGSTMLSNNMELLGFAFAAPVFTFHSLRAYGLETLVFPALGLVFGLLYRADGGRGS